jgi:xanthine dehydrogenase molybdopterin-binding subunit B
VFSRSIQLQYFAGSQSDIICNADMRVGGIRHFYKLQDEGVAVPSEDDDGVV